MVIVLGAAPAALAQATHDYQIRTLSTHANLVSDGDVLVQIDVPRTVPRQQAKIYVNGVDITSTLHWDESARTLTGLVSGLKLGENEIFAD
jgi:hypothetical protein